MRALQSVLGYEIDEHNRMWILDQGKIAYNPSPEESQKLIIWDLAAVSTVIVGATKTEQLDDNLKSLDIVLDETLGSHLDEISGDFVHAKPFATGQDQRSSRTYTLQNLVDNQFERSGQ